jgi:SpoVK/Ycf46/Vps4 family AAA+-type ATPase
MIDPALLRSGRFELHIKIGKLFVSQLLFILDLSTLDLPSTKGRFDILKSLIEPLQMNARLASDVNEAVLAQIAESTINYSGAELKQLIQCASRAAIRRVITVILKATI